MKYHIRSQVMSIVVQMAESKQGEACQVDYSTVASIALETMFLSMDFRTLET